MADPKPGSLEEWHYAVGDYLVNQDRYERKEMVRLFRKHAASMMSDDATVRSLTDALLTNLTSQPDRWYYLLRRLLQTVPANAGPLQVLALRVLLGEDDATLLHAFADAITEFRGIELNDVFRKTVTREVLAKVRQLCIDQMASHPLGRIALTRLLHSLDNLNDTDPQTQTDAGPV